MGVIMSDPLDRVAYVQYLAQLYAIYTELEDAADHLVHDPEVGVFLRPELQRTPALVADLITLVGTDWASRIRVLPATARYVNRLHHVAVSWPAGYLAHHYTRYLGDLSGGFFIGRALGNTLGLAGNEGRQFFAFDAIPAPGPFKDWYRDHLDSAAWTEAEQDRIISEAVLAYRLNTELMDDIMTALSIPGLDAAEVQ
ncbi:MAG: heme oxygenase [Pseudonocardiales bacterium]|nr:heme oxygenase [Pseudonocardiales bacterium]